MTNANSLASMYSPIDMLPWVDMSYATWQVSDKRRETFLRQRKDFGISDFDSYNLSNSVAGLLANTLILANSNDMLPNNQIWEGVSGNIVNALPMKEEVFNAITILSYFATDSDATYAIKGKDEIERAFLVAFAILPMLKDPSATTDELNEELKKAYRGSRCVRMVCQFDVPNLGYNVIHMISSLLINLANNCLSIPAEYAEEEGKWESLLHEAAANFIKQENASDNSIPKEAQDFFIDHLATLWD